MDDVVSEIDEETASKQEKQPRPVCNYLTKMFNVKLLFFLLTFVINL